MKRDKPVDGITFAFYKAQGDWRNKAVRWATRSLYSHCEAVLSLAEFDEKVVCHSASSRDGGVRSKEIILRADMWDLLHLPLCFYDEKRTTTLIETAAGAAYDYPGIMLSHVFSLNRHASHRWFCSEFCAELIGVPNPHTYSPQAFYDLVRYMREQTMDMWPDDCKQGHG